MRFLAFISLILLSFSAQAKSQFVVGFTSIAIENKNHTLPNQIVCFGGDWKYSDAMIHEKIINLETTFPAVFIIKDGANPNHCFDPEKITPQSKPLFDEIFKLIELKTGNKVTLQLPKKTPSLLIPSTYHEPGSLMLKNEDRPFGVKLLRTTTIVQGTQLTSLGLLLALPPSITKWPDKPLQSFNKHLQRAYHEAPVWDQDDWYVNYIGHPVAGAHYYNMVRSQGATPLQSFLYSTSQSIFWEYVVEAVAEQPSIQDLLFTSTIGSILGEGAHQATLKMSRNGFNFAEKTLVILINPSYVINNGFKVKRHKPALRY